MARVHILGASGSGKTTLGAMVAARLGAVHVDSDDVLWFRTDPPFTTLRPVEERVTMLVAALPAAGRWVLSGNALSWARPIEPLCTLVVFLHLDPETRMGRLRRREAERYGSRIAPGGDMVDASARFLDEVSGYEASDRGPHSLALHETWLATQPAPVLRLDAAARVPDLLAAVLDALDTPPLLQPRIGPG